VVYWAGPSVGGALGALVYTALFRGPHKAVTPSGPTAAPLIDASSKEMRHMQLEA